MRFLAGQGHLQPPKALPMSNDADILVFRFEDWPLLDMKLEHCMDFAATDRLIAFPADALQFVAECLALGVGALIGPVLIQHACKNAGSKHGGGKARAFLIGPVDHDDGAFGPDIHVVERAHDFEATEHAQHAVKLAAGRLCIQMAAHIDGVRVGILAGTGEEHIAHRVHAHGKPGLFAPALKQLAAFAVLIGQGLAVIAAAHAGADLRHFHKAVPQAISIDSEIATDAGIACEHHALCLLTNVNALQSVPFYYSPDPPASLCSRDPALRPQCFHLM